MPSVVDISAYAGPSSMLTDVWCCRHATTLPAGPGEERTLAPQLPAVPGLTIATPGQAEAWILGPASQLYATGSLSVPLASWRGERIRDVDVAYRYHAGMLQFDRITATYGATVAAMLRLGAVVLVLYGGLLVLTGWQFARALRLGDLAAVLVVQAGRPAGSTEAGRGQPSGRCSRGLRSRRGPGAARASPPPPCR